MRCFIAIELPEAVKSALSGIEEELKRTGADVRWVKPENIHLTLKFLGNIEDSKAEKIADIMEKICNRCRPFEIEIKGAGMFPNTKSPRVLWSGLENSNVLKSLQEEIDEGMEAIGFDREKRGFTAHLTLGRVRSLKGKERLVEVMRLYEKENIGKMNVVSVSFMRSDLHPEGSRYTKIAEFPFGR